MCSIMRQLISVTSTVTQWTQSVTDSNATFFADSLASRHNFASFRSCDYYYWDKRWQNNKRVYKEFFVNVVNVYHIYVKNRIWSQFGLGLNWTITWTGLKTNHPREPQFCHFAKLIKIHLTSPKVLMTKVLGYQQQIFLWHNARNYMTCAW